MNKEKNKNNNNNNDNYKSFCFQIADRVGNEYDY